MICFNRKTMINIVNILLNTKSVSVAIVIDKSEHEKIISELKTLDGGGLYNPMRNTFKKDGEIFFFHNIHSNITGKAFDHIFYYKNLQSLGSIKAKKDWIFE